MRPKEIILLVLWPTPLLVVPLLAMRFSAEVNWTALDFAAAWALLCAAGFAYRLATRRDGQPAYRAAAALAVGTCLLLAWANLAVGIIGSERNPANLLYATVLATGVVGALRSRFHATGMARTLFAMAVAHLLVTAIALAVTPPEFNDGTSGREIVFNAGFALLFAGAGWLFRHASQAGSRGPNIG